MGGSVSCWGANITDTRLYEKTGKLLYTCRSDNWNEKLGRVSADEIAVVVGNEQATVTNNTPVSLKPITLADFLKRTGTYASYTGVKADTNLYDATLDSEVSIRFQTTFLPVDESGCTEFCTEAYNYNTLSDSDPRNAIVLCTTQGIAFQQDGAGAKKLFHHSVDSQGNVHQHWLEAERSAHTVGGAQIESKEEAVAAAARGKATASVIGIEAMGTRFNALMTVQIPLQQKRKQIPVSFFAGAEEEMMSPAQPTGSKAASALDFGLYEDQCLEIQAASALDFGLYESTDYLPNFKDQCQSVVASVQGTLVGTANAARVSRGSEVSGAGMVGVKNKEPKRDPGQHVTVTIVLYNTVVGGVPSMSDVAAAIEDMERLYAVCAWSGKLSEKGADFMKSKLTIAEAAGISKKITTQPYTAPKCAVVQTANVFPRTETRPANERRHAIDAPEGRRSEAKSDSTSPSYTHRCQGVDP